jgi:D-sedoheptulose 7-phosphate isomerase
MYKYFLEEDIEITKKLLPLERVIKKIIRSIYSSIKNKKKIFICGNGGSAADAQHLAAEFLVRLRPKVNRRPFPLISLMQDSSTFSACSNDYGFKYIFSRNLEAMASKGDLLICLTTSGKSKNIIEVIKYAKKNGIKVISFLGKDGGPCRGMSDLELLMPTDITAKIQESHLMLGHYILQQVEDKFLGEKK